MATTTATTEATNEDAARRLSFVVKAGSASGKVGFVTETMIVATTVMSNGVQRSRKQIPF